MPAVRQRPLARDDLLDIWAPIAADNIRAADAFVDRLDRAFFLLGANPKSGRARPDIGPGMLAFRDESSSSRAALLFGGTSP